MKIRAQFWIWVEWVLLGIGLTLLVFSELFQPNIPIIFGLLLAACLVRSLRTHRFLPHTGAELPMGIFLASAVLSTWVAYDRSLALIQFTRLFASMVAFYAVVESNPLIRRLLMLGLALTSIALGAYFILTHDFSAETGKFSAITALGRSLNAHLPVMPGPGVDPNVAGSMLILGIPLAVFLAVEAWKSRRAWLAGLIGLLALLGLAELILTSSRGAWLGLAGMLGLGLLVWIQRHWLAGPKGSAAFWLAIASVAVVIAVVMARTGLLDHLLGNIPDPTGSLQSRLSLWGQGLLLARAYPFTGIGLLSFPMVFSIYILLVHDIWVSHIHNTYLQVLIEQGWPGFLAMLGLGVAGLRWTWNLIRRNVSSPLAWGALAALCAIALHGLFDVTMYLERPLPLVGLVAGILAYEVPSPSQRTRSIQNKAVIVTLLAFLVAGVIFWHPMAAAAYANLGAITQTRLEMGHLDPQHWDNPTLDKIRQSIDLSRAEGFLGKALSLAPNLTARQRLAGIAMSVGQYTSALEWMEAAWQGGARDQVTRLLYGDALVASGQLETAARVIDGLPRAEGRLMEQAWYRYTLGKDYPRAIAAWQTVLLLNPDNSQAPAAIVNLSKQLH